MEEKTYGILLFSSEHESTNETEKVLKAFSAKLGGKAFQLSFGILRRAEAELFCEAQDKMLQAVEAGLEANLRHGQRSVREQELRVLQAHVAQELIRATLRDLFEQAAEVKRAHMPVTRNLG